jgi:hypothetical protein
MTNSCPIYRGVIAYANRFRWTAEGSRLGYVTVYGQRRDLIRAGLLPAADRIPKPHGCGKIGAASKATARHDGTIRLTLEQPEAAARDLAFRRFMALALGERA